VQPLVDYFSVWRTTWAHDREIIDAVVRPDHRGPSPEVRAALKRWPGPHYWVGENGDGRLLLIRPLAAPPRERWWLHAALFLTTFLSVAMGGALLAGVHPRAVFPILLDFDAFPDLLLAWADAIRPGVEFAMALMGVLLAHESGHYFMAQRYSINASPPYFLPAPPNWVFLGTLGAFIRLRSPVVDRRQLMDVGAAGPWAGFVVAMVLLVVGLTRSQVVAGLHRDSLQVMLVAGSPFYLGDSPLLMLLRPWLAGDGTVLLHPLALAGWFGMFVTALNLLPFGQLDGGHVLYALIGRRQRVLGILTWFALVGLGWYFKGWWLWAALVLLLGRGRLSHPSVLDRHSPVPRSRRWLGWATVLLFGLTFTPIPFYS